MSEVYHQGEIAVQKLAGVEEMASRIGRSIHPVMHPIAQNFLSHQPFVIAASMDKNGKVWASILTGDVGFIEIIDEKTVRIDISKIGEDVLVENIKINNNFK